MNKQALEHVAEYLWNQSPRGRRLAAIEPERRKSFFKKAERVLKPVDRILRIEIQERLLDILSEGHVEAAAVVEKAFLILGAERCARCDCYLEGREPYVTENDEVICDVCKGEI